MFVRYIIVCPVSGEVVRIQIQLIVTRRELLIDTIKLVYQRYRPRVARAKMHRYAFLNVYPNFASAPSPPP